MTIIEPPEALLPGTDACDQTAEALREAPPERPWLHVTTPDAVDLWIERHNAELQGSVRKTHAAGYGVCFLLAQGGRIFMHCAEDAILLDVTPEAEWASPVITAATGIAAPRSQIWVLPAAQLTQLILGLNSLIASTSMVASHRYQTRKH